MPTALKHFQSIWCIVMAVDIRRGEPPVPIAIAAMDLSTNVVVQVGTPKLRGVRRPPYPMGPLTLIVTVDAHLLAGVHFALGWRMPERVIDLITECRNMRRAGREFVGGLAGALAEVGQPASIGLEAGSSPNRMRRRLDAVTRLFAGIRDRLDLGRSLLRGRYLCAVSRIEATGIPIDAELIERLSNNWPRVLERIIVDSRRTLRRLPRPSVGHAGILQHDRAPAH